MKWFFALSEASLSTDNLYADCIRVAVMSANRNTSLIPHFLYDGGENQFIDEMRSFGVNIIHHRSTLYDNIVADKPDDNLFIRIASGAFLRIDIPIIENDEEFVFYTDCDVMFLKDPDLRNIKPNYFAVAPEFTRGDYANMNSGVMLINVPEMRRIHEELIQHIKKSRISDLPAFDQGALRTFFKGIYDKLPETLNWKPYWGKNQDAEIIHFHGPKPPHAKALMNNRSRRY
jgi:lipopolysaccharide biosynthesis glycosyltransferase